MAPLEAIGNYEVLAKLGEGGVGAVYKARHLATGQLVAIKLIAPSIAADAVLLFRFEQEFLAVSRLNHPNVVQALSFGQDGPAHYLVMEYVEGETLGQRLKRQGKLPETEAVRLLVQIARALQAAHLQDLLHRDVKPDNILITPDGQAKLTDFGLVKDLSADLSLTATRTALGTPHFMAPEQFDDARNADARSDVYSLGATLYAAVTGELPFYARSKLSILKKKVGNEFVPPRELTPELSERTDQVLCRALRADPDQRPQSCLEFINELTSARPAVVKASPSVQLMPSPGVTGLIKKAGPEGETSRRPRGTARYRSSRQDPGKPSKAILINLSEGGVHMLVQERFEVGDTVEVELVASLAALKSEANLRLVHEAEVGWIEAGGGNGLYYHVGCRWKRRLSLAELKRFT